MFPPRHKYPKQELVNFFTRDRGLSRAQQRQLKKISRSQSQLGQDIFALAAAGFPKTGYFVEFGATDGISFSNTYFLEQELGWKGILAEPAESWHKSLIYNRSSIICLECVWSATGEKILFSETEDPVLSSVTEWKNEDFHSPARQNSRDYEVATVSLVDLLQRAEAPKDIAFLSIDTEGSEYAILEAFDFSKYHFGAIAIEHNFSDTRSKIRNLLIENGYVNVLTEYSNFDDWYIPAASPAETLKLFKIA